MRTFVCLRTFYSQLGNVHHVYCPNVESEQSGKYTPFPRERHRSAAELILCGHSSGTWSFHSSLLSPPPPEKSGEHARVGEVTGVRECGRWEIDFMYVRERTCVFSRVGYQHGPLPSAQSLHSALSLSAL